MDAELLTIPFSLQEVEKYKGLILQKSKLTEEQFCFVLEKIREKVALLADEIVETRFDETFQIMKDIDVKDSPFLAAALATNSAIWSDDPHFKRQNKVKVRTTAELVRF